MSKMQRTKGASFERLICAWFKKMGWKSACRNLTQYQKTDGKDLNNTEPYCCQLKCGKKINIIAAYNEAKEAAKKGEIPICISKIDRKEVLVTMRLKDFGYLL